MWVFIRPRGGQDCYLLTRELRGGLEYCPIHRFDGMDQIPLHGRGPSQKFECKPQISRMRVALLMPHTLKWKTHEKFLEMNSDRDCPAGSDSPFFHR